MTEATGISKIAGRTGSLLLVVGLAAFLIGLFGPVRNVMFVGIGLMLLSFASFFIEEFGPRK